ncbi:hypothetical protein CRUP_019045 [Coryphaenoides rupestris]|nr:hypothetical protein CRUP_019045 [Coryphaenoides rupestris]
MSSGNKAIELQLQMRQNAEDLHSFMRELDTWETDIKKKDQELRTGGVQDDIQRSQSLPPVRNKDFKKKQWRKAKPSVADGQSETADEPKEPLRINSYDYRAWDKFDVDKAMSAVDKEQSPAEGSDSDSEEALGEVDHSLALAQKEQGNALFREGRYDDAIECYTRGMSADPYNPVLPTNRATCFYRLKKFSVAESDCNLAIALDANYFKAFARRGAAKAALGEVRLGLKKVKLPDDYEAVLKLDPGNLDAQMEVKKMKVLAGQGTDGPGPASPPDEAPAAVDPLQQRRVEEQQKRQEAVVQKDRGNAYFKEGKYEAAVDCYTAGMEADATNALLPANRAMAYLKLERYEEAEQDCGAALSLDSTYSKALARRGTARLALGRLREAQQGTFCFCGSIVFIFNEATVLNALLSSLETGPPGLLGTEENAPRRTVQPVDKPPHLRSTKPLRRVDIEEVGGEVLLDVGALGGGPSGLPPRQRSHSSASSSAPGQDPAGGDLASPLSTSPSAKILKIEEISDTPTRLSEAPVATTSASTSATTSASTSASTTASTSTGLMPSPDQTLALPPAATNSFQLEADLRKIGRQPQQIYEYLRQMDAAAFAKIFQNALEPDLLNQILRTLLEFYTKTESPDLILGILASLASVRRFDMAVMFMSTPEKKVLQELFDFLHQAHQEEATLATLRKKYGV